MTRPGAGRYARDVASNRRGIVLEVVEVNDGNRHAILAAQAADTKSGLETTILDVGDVLAITGHFVVTSAPNSRQVKTIVEEIEHVLTEFDGTKPTRVEGLDTLSWVLMDYGHFVVHVFLDESRGFYELERLWSDVDTLAWTEVESIASLSDGASVRTGT